MYYSPAGDNLGGTYPWVYYQLGGNNEQLAVYNGFSLSDPFFWTSPTNVCAQPSPPRTAFLYPVEYNSYGAGSTIDFSYRVDENGVWRKDYSIRDHLGDVRMVLRKNTNDNNYVVSSAFDYKPFGERINVDVSLDNINRTGFIAKEKDNESLLGDFGVRKYEDNFGRFTSIDKLYEKYTGWTPYHYCRNNPISRTDGAGLDDPIAYAKTGLGSNENDKGFDPLISSINNIIAAGQAFLKQLTQGTYPENVKDMDGNLLSGGEITKACMNTLADIGLTVLGGLLNNLSTTQLLTSETKSGAINSIKNLPEEIQSSVKSFFGNSQTKYTDFKVIKDSKGNVYQKLKNGKGPGEPLDINLKELQR